MPKDDKDNTEEESDTVRMGRLLVFHQDHTVCNEMYKNVYEHQTFPTSILGGVVVVLHVCDLDATLYLKQT